MVLFNDINFNAKYLTSYEKVDGGKLKTFSFSCSIGKAFVHYIKRPLEIFTGYEGYYDIITPYGYGGQIIAECEDGCESRLISLFNDAFLQHCRQEKIISYFARFNPFAENAEPFRDFFDELLPVRKVVAMDLTKDTITEEVTKKCMTDYRASIARGTKVEICSTRDQIDDFIALYYSDMESKNAQDYYFFPQEYFEYIFNAFPDNMVLFSANAEGRVIAYSISIVYGDIAYYHLACRNEGFNYYKANYAITISAAEYARSKGCKLYVLGGGLSSDEKDSLYKFKKNFSVSEPRSFYIGKKVLDEQVYEDLCGYVEKSQGKKLSQEFFPAYRCPQE